jgi:hypothetical protein
VGSRTTSQFLYNAQGGRQINPDYNPNPAPAPTPWSSAGYADEATWQRATTPPSFTGLLNTPSSSPFTSGQAPAFSSGQGMTTPQASTFTPIYSTTPGDSTRSTTTGSISNDAFEKQQQMQLAAQLQQQAEQRRLGYMSSVRGSSPEVTRGNLATDEAGARAAAFGRAKDQAAQTASASVQALHDVMAGRGMQNGSQEQSRLADIFTGAGQGVDEFTREQLIQDLNRAAEISDTNYRGAITQRGQNLAMVPSLMGLITAGSGVY